MAKKIWEQWRDKATRAEDRAREEIQKRVLVEEENKRLTSKNERLERRLEGMDKLYLQAVNLAAYADELATTAVSITRGR